VTVVLSAVFAPPLNGASITLGPGLHVVLGTDLDGTRELVALLAGVSTPRRGSVRVSEKDPRSVPAIRRRIGALLAEESLPPALTVSRALGLALGARNDPQKPEQLLEEAKLSAWAGRRTDSLAPAEQRRLALLLAVSLRGPAGRALYEPLPVAGNERERVTELLAKRADGGTVVLAATASPRDASELGGSVLLLERGRFVRHPEQPLAVNLAPGTPPQVRIRCSDARRLAAELAKDPAVTSLHCSEEPGSELLVSGPNPDVLALSIARAVQGSEVAVLALQCSLPAIEAVHAASEGLMRGAYEAAQRAAYEAAVRAAPPYPVPSPAPAPPAPSAPPPPLPPPENP
jgi:ABC-type multidrug transport system ATPase subunit